MSEKRSKLRRALIAFCRARGVRYYNEGQYPNPARQARSGGRRVKGTKERVQDKLANGMLIHIPNFGWSRTTVGSDGKERTWTSPRVYLLHYGEPLDEVELAFAQLEMFNPTGRTEIYVIACDGERP